MDTLVAATACLEWLNLLRDGGSVGRRCWVLGLTRGSWLHRAWVSQVRKLGKNRWKPGFPGGQRSGGRMGSQPVSCRMGQVAGGQGRVVSMDRQGA